MTTKVISILDHLRRNCPARDALDRVLETPLMYDWSISDQIMSGLWGEGFKIVSIEDDTEPPESAANV